jgi:hypothetical protein
MIIEGNSSMEHWWNDIEGGKLKNLEKNLSQCHPVQHQSHMECPGIEPQASAV